MEAGEDDECGDWEVARGAAGTGEVVTAAWEVEGARKDVVGGVDGDAKAGETLWDAVMRGGSFLFTSV